MYVFNKLWKNRPSVALAYHYKATNRSIDLDETVKTETPCMSQ